MAARGAESDGRFWRGRPHGDIGATAGLRPLSVSLLVATRAETAGTEPGRYTRTGQGRNGWCGTRALRVCGTGPFPVPNAGPPFGFSKAGKMPAPRLDSGGKMPGSLHR